MLPQSSIGAKSALDRSFNKDIDGWLKERKFLDGAEGLWRINDGLYDLTSFIKMHPGGQFWIRETKGMDITEAFEVHHISTIPNDILRHYYVRVAKKPRNSPFTFEDDGFYKTLKANVKRTLKTIPKDVSSRSNFYTDLLLFFTFLFGILAGKFWNFYLGIISGIFLAATISAGHNYSHQRDNFRMYYGDLCMQECRVWRVLHVLSHHVYTNTVSDMQMYMLEPLIILFPEKKSLIHKYGSWIYVPFIYWPTMHLFITVAKILKVFKSWENIMVDILPFIFPIAMYTFSNQSIITIILMWQFILCIGSILFNYVAWTSGHIHPEVFVDGDTIRSKKVDWGIHQLDTTVDRKEVTGNLFLVLTSLGDHVLHHLFPAFDHAVLPYLYSTVKETAEQFNVNVRMFTNTNLSSGIFRRLAKDTPNPEAPKGGI